MEFDVADGWRPLLSITEIVAKKRHRVVYGDPVSYIEDKSTGRKVKLAFEGNLECPQCLGEGSQAYGWQPSCQAGRLANVSQRQTVRPPMFNGRWTGGTLGDGILTNYDAKFESGEHGTSIRNALPDTGASSRQEVLEHVVSRIPV